MAMRQNYWNDTHSAQVDLEKIELKNILSEYGVFDQPSLDDAKYFFFSLPRTSLSSPLTFFYRQR